MPTRRLRNREPALGTGHGHSPPIVMPGVPWCEYCRKTLARKKDSRVQYICMQGDRCCYKRARTEWWAKYDATPITFDPSRGNRVRKSKVGTENTRERNLELIKRAAEEYNKKAKAKRVVKGSHTGKVMRGKDGRFCKVARVGVGGTRGRSANLRLSEMRNAIHR